MPQIRSLPRRARLSALAAVTLLTTGVLSSCGGQDGGSSDRLRVALAFPPAQGMSPYGDDAVTLSRLAAVEGLTRLDHEGGVKPALATSWKPSDDGRTWTLRIREARFQDGGKVTAEDVVRSLEKAGQAAPKPRVLSDAGDWEVTADGDRTVRVTTSEPDVLMPQRLANPALSVLSAEAYRGKKTDPVGHATGPFTVTRVNGTASATLERHDAYWGGRAEAPGIDVRFVADGTARANALRSGQVDIAEAVPVSQASVLEKEQVHEVPTARTSSLHLNTADGPFADAGLRAAVRGAVDGKALAESVYEGRADTPRGLFGPGIGWAQETREKEKPGGKPTAPASREEVRKAPAVTLATYSNRPELPEAASLVEQQLEKRGFRVKQVVRDYAQLEADALDGRYDVFLQARNTLLDTGDPLSYLQSDTTCEGSFNISQLCDEDVDAAVREAAAAEDEKERRAAEIRAESRVLRTGAVVPLVHERFVQGVAENVHGVDLDPLERRFVTTETRRG